MKCRFLLGFVEKVLLNGCVGECVNTSRGLKDKQTWSPADSGIHRPSKCSQISLFTFSPWEQNGLHE